MKRRDAIIEAATYLFSEKGFKETSTAEVAERSGVAQGTLFYHFKTKEGMLLKVYETVMDSYLSGLRTALEGEDTGLEAVLEAVRFHFRFSHAREKEVLVLMRDFPAQFTAPDFPHRGLVAGKSACIIGLLLTSLEAGMADGSIRPIAAEETAHMLRAMLYGLTRQRLLGPFPVPQVTGEAVQFCRQALTNSPSKKSKPKLGQ
jgi:AcrR family transcriptional regulator